MDMDFTWPSEGSLGFELGILTGYLKKVVQILINVYFADEEELLQLV